MGSAGLPIGLLHMWAVDGELPKSSPEHVMLPPRAVLKALHRQKAAPDFQDVSAGSPCHPMLHSGHGSASARHLSGRR